MANIAFIPVRGGSKSIPLKNIKDLMGRPLVYWTAFAAQNATCIDKLVIATDCGKIKEIASTFDFGKLEIYDRKAENAQDTSSTESVMLEYIEKSTLKNDDNFFLIQATSPLLQAEHIDEMFTKMQKENADSALSCVENKRFYWEENGTAINYDYTNRPRRQDFKGYLMENGACYINSVKNILKYKNRLSGKICVYEMPEYTATEIDEENDWIILEKLMEKYILEEKSFNCKLLLTDCDGVLTDGGMYYGKNGEELKKFNTRDGMAFELLRNAGIITGIITGENSPSVIKRAEKIKADELHLGIKNKLTVAKEICKKYNIHLNEVAYIGDDINDLDLLKAVGFSACPADAHKLIKENVNYLSPILGGNGVIRDFSEKILKHRIKANP